MAYDETVYNMIYDLKDDLGGTLVKDMSLTQLEMVYKAFKMIKHKVHTANSIFREGRTEDLMAKTSAVQEQIMSHAKKGKKDPVAGVDDAVSKVKGFIVNEMKPLTAFELIGSDALTELFWDAMKADGEFGRIITNAGDYLAEQRAKYHYAEWDMNTAKEFKLADGKIFKLTLGDIMSIYAYSKRDQAYDHMTEGGFVFDENNRYSEKLLGKISIKRKHARLTDTYRVDQSLLREIIGLMNKSEYADVKSYTDAMQEYFVVMGEMGNKISNILFGIDLFTEKFYIPLQSSKDYINSNREALSNAETQVSLKNTGMTKSTKPGANNPIVLRQFDDIWLEHIEQMAKYCAYVLPIENLQRVFNNVSSIEGESPMSTKALIASVFGNEVKAYIDQYIKDLNGGANGASGYKSPIMNMFAKFKKTATGAKLSVMVQQVFAIIRAMTMIRPDYFAPFLHGIAKTKGVKAWEEIKQYTSVGIIKEMGGFDMGYSGSAKDYIGTTEYHGFKGKVKGLVKDSDYRKKAFDDGIMIGATKADELGWTIIWYAVKKEVTNTTKLTPGTKEFLEACGKRFDEVIVRTQVYDSVNSRSGLIRSKSDLNKFATSFMGEPTTIVNMFTSKFISLARAIKSGDKAQIAKEVGGFARTSGVVVASIVLTTLAKSAIYANYDDEEDESWTERWMRNFGESLSSDLNPLNMFPYLRDIVSIYEGWDVERPDMTLIANLVTSSKRLLEDGATWEETFAFAGDVANAFGIPAKNVVKDIKGIINLIEDHFDSIETEDAWEAFGKGWSGDSDTDALYEAIMDGDESAIEYYKKSYDSESDYNSAIRKALRDNDPRIKEAAQADIDGDIAEYYRIVNEILAEGNFSEENIKAAIKAEINALTEDEEETPSESKKQSFYEARHYYSAITGGNSSLANEIRDDIIETAMANGKSRGEAESSFNSSFRTYCRDEYKEGGLTRNEAMRLITTYGGMESDDAYWELKKWDYYVANDTYDGYSKYTDFYEAVRTGRNLKAVIKEYTDHGVENKTLASQITSYYKPIYREMSNSERASLKGYLLNAYALLGYNRNEKAKDINKWLED
jgi:hypothetical protein